MAKVGIVTSSAVSLVNVAHDISDALRKSGHETHVFTQLLSVIDAKRMFEKCVVVTVFSPISIPSWFMLWRDLNKAGIPSKLYVTVEGIPKPHLIYDWLKRECKAVANSYFTKNALEEQGILVEEVVYHGIDLELVKRAKHLNPPIRKNPDKVLFGFVANAQARKGHDRLAQAIKHAKERVPEAEFYILTEPAAAKHYAGLENARVDTRFGAFSREQVLALIGSFDFYLGVTLSEGFGLPVLEAQAMGVPVIYLDYAPLNEIAEPKHNIPVPYQSVDKIDVGHGILYTLHMYDPLSLVEAIEAACQLYSDKKAYSKAKRAVSAHARKFDSTKLYPKLVG